MDAASGIENPFQSKRMGRLRMFEGIYANGQGNSIRNRAPVNFAATWGEDIEILETAFTAVETSGYYSD